MTQSQITDEKLVERIVQTRDTLLFEVLYDRYDQLVYNKCLSFSKNREEAQDLTQDVFLKVYLKLASFKGKSKFSTWLYAFTYNHCVNYVNRSTSKKIQKQSINNEHIENIGEKELDSGFELIKVEKLKKVLNKISPDEKMILLLKYQDGLSIKEIGQALELGNSAVKMRVKRAKEKVLTIYKNHYG